VLELGSGGGFLHELVPEVARSDVMRLPGLDVVLAGERLPFAVGALKAIVMTNVLHHLPDVRAFLREATCVVRKGGRLVMVEPWNTAWSRLVYRHLHHEPFDPGTREWALAPAGGGGGRGRGGPLSAANGALPWIVFARDRARFAEWFPEWEPATVTPLMPLAYLLSGGASLRVGAPAVSYRFVRWAESLVPRGACAMFALIVLERRRVDAQP